MDKGHRYTDKQIEILEKRLRQHYKSVNKQLRNRLIEYLKDNKEYYEELWHRLDEGEITEGQFEYLVESDNGLETIQGEMVNDCVEGDSKAMVIRMG